MLLHHQACVQRGHTVQAMNKDTAVSLTATATKADRKKMHDKLHVCHVNIVSAAHGIQSLPAHISCNDALEQRLRENSNRDSN